MQTDLEALAAKLEALAARYARLQAENRVLGERVAQRESARDELQSRLDAARDRLATLLDRLPEDAR